MTDKKFALFEDLEMGQRAHCLRQRQFDFYGVGGGGGDFFEKKFQDSIFSENNIQDRGKCYSTLCIRGE